MSPPNTVQSEPSEKAADLESSGERAVFAWLEGVEEPPSSASDDTLQGMRVSLDAWGRYGATSDDQTLTRERRLRRLVRQYAAREYAAALATAERMLREDSDDPDAMGFAAGCRTRLEAAHLEAMGGRSTTLRLGTGGRMLRALETDERTSLLVALVRRGVPLGEILDLQGPRRLDALLVIARLVSARILMRD